MKKTENIIDNEQKIKELQAENQRLRRELHRYKRQKEFGDSIYARHHEKTWQINLRQGASKENLFERKNFASYLFGTFKNRTFFLYYQKFIYVIRKYTFITATLKILFFLWTILQSSALFVLFTGSVAIGAPITILFSYMALMLTFFGRKNLNHRLRHTLEGKKITVFFPSKGRAFEHSSYFKQMVRSSANDPDHAVVIVSPYYFAPKGFSRSKKYYLASRFESENIILIRKHYFFTFKKHVLSDMSHDLTFIF